MSKLFPKFNNLKTVGIITLGLISVTGYEINRYVMIKRVTEGRNSKELIVQEIDKVKSKNSKKDISGDKIFI